jgi:glutamine synthetase
MLGHEIEFLLVGPDGSALPSVLWAQYGLAGVLEHEEFVRDVTTAAAAAGIGIEQFHPEYGLNQFEISLSPLSPVAGADQLVLMRLVIARVARRYGVRVSYSPVPFAGSVGNGAHQHFSLTKSGIPVFEGGSGVHGMTDDGEHAIGGILAGIAEAQGVLSGSIVSGFRMQPGFWAGANVCWGTENREAAVRFLAGGPANPHGGNVEVKITDPSANPYFASAVILGLALDGIEQRTALPPEVTVDPAKLSDDERSTAGVVTLPTDQATVISALDGSERIRAILGDAAVDATVAVRRYEQENYGDLEPAELADKFRMAWSL